MTATNAPTASRSSASENRGCCRAGGSGAGLAGSRQGRRFGPRHAGIAPVARTAKENRRADTHGSQRLAEFADAVTAKLVGVIDAKLCPPVTDDFALFAQSAGDDAHLGAATYVVRDGGAV